MEATSFASCYGLLLLPPVRAVTNSLSFSHLPLFSSRKITRLDSAGRRMCKTASSPLPVLRISCGMIREIKETEFSEVVLKSNRPVLVEFVATWCGPCRLMASVIESLAQGHIKRSQFAAYCYLKEKLHAKIYLHGQPCCRITKSDQEYEDKLTIVKIDHDSNPQLIQDYKVYGLPALILFKNGEEVPGSRREGAIPKPKLKMYIDGLLESVSIA